VGNAALASPGGRDSAAADIDQRETDLRNGASGRVPNGHTDDLRGKHAAQGDREYNGGFDRQVHSFGRRIWRRDNVATHCG
jgi:hypothetical protein